MAVESGLIDAATILALKVAGVDVNDLKMNFTYKKFETHDEIIKYVASTKY